MQVSHTPPSSRRRPRIAAPGIRPVLVAGLLVAGTLPMTAPTAMAAGILEAAGGISTGNLRFELSDPAAVLTWQTDWYGEVGAYAHGADAGEDTGYWYVIGNDASTATSAQVPGGLFQSSYAVTDGAQVAITPGAALAAGARVDIALRSRSQQADGYAYSTWNNYFSISSASPLGPTVGTTISVDYTGTAEASANHGAYFELLLDALLALYAVDASTFDLIEPALGVDAWTQRYSGRRASVNDAVNGTLAITVDLPYNDIHWLYAGVQSTAYGVPVAGTVPLFFAGWGLLMHLRRRRGQPGGRGDANR